MRIKYSAEVFDEPYFSGTITLRLTSISANGQMYAEMKLPLEQLQTESIVDVVFEKLKKSLKEEINKAGLV